MVHNPLPHPQSDGQIENASPVYIRLNGVRIYANFLQFNSSWWYDATCSNSSANWFFIWTQESSFDFHYYFLTQESTLGEKENDKTYYKLHFNPELKIC